MGQVYQNPSAEEHYNHSALKRILFIAFHIPEEAELADKPKPPLTHHRS
jgi:hypothetical protein